jgi:hypothetical protein
MTLDRLTRSTACIRHIKWQDDPSLHRPQKESIGASPSTSALADTCIHTYTHSLAPRPALAASDTYTLSGPPRRVAPCPWARAPEARSGRLRLLVLLLQNLLPTVAGPHRSEGSRHAGYDETRHVQHCDERNS